MNNDENKPGEVVMATFNFPRSAAATAPVVQLAALASSAEAETAAVEEETTTVEAVPEPYVPCYYAVTSPGNNDIIPDAKHYTVELPSKGAFYGNDGVVVATLVKGKHQLKFNRAAQYASYRYTAEAVGSTLHLSDVGSLTLQDFIYLMYWLRTNSYPKNQYTHVTYCQDPHHKKQVEEGSAEESTLKTVDIVTKTNIETEPLNPALLSAFVESCKGVHLSEITEINGAGLQLSAPMVRDVIVMSEVDEGEDEDTRALLDLAIYTRGIDHEFTLAERAALLGDLSPDAVSLVQAWMVIVTSYGVTESRAVVCGHCGAGQQVEILLTAWDFSR